MAPELLRGAAASERSDVWAMGVLLFEMATGTGKTLTVAMLMKRWFQSAAISRVLFLADRIELAKQAKETFDDYLRDYPTNVRVSASESGLAKDTVFLCFQLRSLDPGRFIDGRPAGVLGPKKIEDVDRALKLALDLV